MAIHNVSLVRDKLMREVVSGLDATRSFLSCYASGETDVLAVLGDRPKTVDFATEIVGIILERFGARAPKPVTPSRFAQTRRAASKAIPKALKGTKTKLSAAERAANRRGYERLSAKRG